MKVRWREHEIILATILAVILITYKIYSAYNNFLRLKVLRLPGRVVNFHYRYDYLLLQIVCILILYGCYLFIDLKIVPSLKRNLLSQNNIKTLKALIFIILQIAVVIFLLGPGFDFVSFYAELLYHQQFKVISGPPLPLGFAYGPQPFTDFFGGFGVSLIVVPVFLGYIFLREVIISFLEKSAYRALVANGVTGLLVVYFSISVFVLLFYPLTTVFYPLNYSLYLIYTAYIPPALLVYLANTYWLFPLKFQGSFFKWRFIVYLLFSSLVCTLIAFIYILAFTYYPVHIYLFFLKVWACQLIFVTPVSWIYYQQQKDKILKLLGMEKELIQSRADLQFLRSQINPHFLFNALNTLYGTALLEGSKNTATGIQKLGDMMRFMLHENNQDFITMNKEIEFLENYISLQKLRTQVSPDIIIEDNIAVQHCSHQIAPMLLIPFVENAFKHGVSLTERSWIKIKLECDDNNIRFETRNSLHPYMNSDPEKEHSGIGLQNVKERLLLLYPGKHQFTYGEERNEFIVKLSIQL